MASHPEHLGEHPPFLAHHFETPQQQFDTGKLGMWIFLVTEVLFFSGLFCAYAVYRANHPEIFEYAHQFLDKNLGALNTAILIFSSLTMAWAVRCAQLSQRRGLIICLTITLACAAGFLGVKGIEYAHKWEHGLLWAGQYKPHGREPVMPQDPKLHVSPSEHGHDAPPKPATEASTEDLGSPRNAGIFFSIYFAMTGLHGIHVIAGMGVITWLLVRAVRGDFSSQYYNPVDFTALYWHLVDLIWIYLFPLLYLIH